MPIKIRELESQLLKAGFKWKPGKGSHRMWYHPCGAYVNMSGHSYDDAKKYQEKEVNRALKQAGQ